ncbi:MAG: glycosyltransferase [Candidatus Moranbacteria bacterium]|nr:glycosyltransferase [Candidatus Moranbacteria bacterium]
MDRMHTGKIALIIPCHNEEKSIAKVVNGVPRKVLRKLGFEIEIIVVDNCSTDKTNEVCESLDVTLLYEGKKGKGNAMRTGFDAVSDDTSYVVMIDGDHTYKTHEIFRLVEPLASGFCDVVIGSRLGGKSAQDAFLFQNRVVNWGFAFLVRVFYKANITDVLSGYFAWTKEKLDELSPHIESDGFAIEMEMITKMVRLGHEMYSVPITFDVRNGGETKISPFKDGVGILYMFIRNFFWKKDCGRSENLYTDTVSK